jgi:tetratricopeptide (TPR) repeat protein
MNRTGKPETLQSSVGLYFTDVVPTNRAFKMALMSMNLRFAAGESNVVVTDSFTVPVDVEALATLPHSHYLAREIKGRAVLPDGSKQWFLVITNWDFRWQGDYRYVHPLKFPAGTTLHLEAVYDNSTNNLRNPNQPPKLVNYGPQSSDEMCELWLQLLPDSAADYEKLKAAYEAKTRKMFIDRYQFVLKYEPDDPSALTSLGLSQMSEGKLTQALANLQKAIQSDPNFERAHYQLGVLYRLTRHLREAKKELETALSLTPKRAKAWGHLGFVWAELGNAEQADQCFRKSLELDPTDEMVRSSLEELAPHLKKKP